MIKTSGIRRKNGAGIGRKWLSTPVIPDRMTVEISHEPIEPGAGIMCITDVAKETDGTYTAFCYCGWSTNDIESSPAAESIAREHEQNSDARQPQGYPWDED